MSKPIKIGLRHVVAILAVAAFGGTASAGTSHRSPCHTTRTCPSDHHTYRWSAKRLLCTSYRSERVPADKIRVVVSSHVYWCHKMEEG